MEDCHIDEPMSLDEERYAQANKRERDGDPPRGAYHRRPEPVSIPCAADCTCPLCRGCRMLAAVPVKRSA